MFDRQLFPSVDGLLADLKAHSKTVAIALDFDAGNRDRLKQLIIGALARKG